MINRETNTSPEDYLTALFNNLISGKTVYLPRELPPLINKASRQKEGRDNIALVYHLIQSEHQRTEHQRRNEDTDTVGIHSDKFKGISSPNAIIKARDFLENNGFLKVGASYQEGKYSKGHILLKDTDLVEYLLEGKNSNDALYSKTDEDDRCKQTRENLNMVDIDTEHARKIFQMTVYKYLLFGSGELREKDLTSGEKKHIKKGISIENLPDRKVANLHGLLTPLNQIIHEKGGIVRAVKGGRLFSPLTQLKKHFRNCLSVEGERLVSIDMVCCQPSLIACLSQDTRCLDDCVANRFYTKIAERLSVTREQAKETFCEYSFGPHRTEKTQAKNAFAIQNFIKDEYPRFYHYVKAKKKRDYRTFAARLQEVETEIFIEGALVEFQKQNIFALTIHDSVLVKKPDVKRAINVLKKINNIILRKYIPNTESEFQFKVESKIDWSPEKNLIIKPYKSKIKDLNKNAFMFIKSEQAPSNMDNLHADLYQAYNHYLMP